MKKLILTSLVAAFAAITTGTVNAATNPGVQEVFDTEPTSAAALGALNAAWYDWGNLYPNATDLMAAFVGNTLDITKLGDTINHLVALDNYAVQDINGLTTGLNALNSKIEDETDNRKKSEAINTALAGVDTHIDPSKKMAFGVAGGANAGVGGFAFGAAYRIAENGQFNVKAATSANGGFAGTVGASFQF
ncbi:MAG: YadA-like family protein [Rickettsiales bacterium]|jgi:hypothetical protein|nr:YadA-like family protein [Rickettsiales bacterium]